MDPELADLNSVFDKTSPPPLGSAPPANAPYEERAAWSERYVTWFIAQTAPEGPLPPDVAPTHEYMVEFNTCVLDPETYERQTKAELAKPPVH
jgi:hypothetical protein